MPTGTNLDCPFSSLYFSTLGTSYSFSSFQSRSSNPDSTQCYFPKTSACHTHYLWSWKPNMYLDQFLRAFLTTKHAFVPRRVDHILPVFWDPSVSLLWSYYDHRAAPLNCFQMFSLPGFDQKVNWSHVLAQRMSTLLFHELCGTRRNVFKRIAAKSHLCYVRIFHAGVRTVG